MLFHCINLLTETFQFAFRVGRGGRFYLPVALSVCLLFPQCSGREGSLMSCLIDCELMSRTGAFRLLQHLQNAVQLLHQFIPSAGDLFAATAFCNHELVQFKPIVNRQRLKGVPQLRQKAFCLLVMRFNLSFAM